MYFYFIIAAIILIAIVDTYFYYSMRQVVKGRERNKLVPLWARILYWSFTAFTIIFYFVALSYFSSGTPPPKFARIYITGFIFIVLLSKIIGIVFFIIDDAHRGLLFLKKLVFPPKPESNPEGSKISRGVFLKQSGLVMTALPFATMMYGVVKSAFDYNVIKIKLKSPKIPEAFNGYRIVQISDIHTGSFISDSPLKDAVQLINDQNPDVVFFTGDLVNEVAEEALPFVDILKNISAKDGVFSILGNHDYGDYFYKKGNEKGRAHNYALIKDIHHRMKWDILLNENRNITRNGQSIGLIGVENWGHSSRFQKYGDMNLAKTGMGKHDFNILLSHDPSHWSHQIITENKDIDLTLSGHTHGMQMGIEIPGYIKWSPSQYLYDQWAGLYQNQDQMIYVNRGLGFLGYPGRLGILPEITVIELERSLA